MCGDRSLANICNMYARSIENLWDKRSTIFCQQSRPICGKTNTNFKQTYHEHDFKNAYVSSTFGFAHTHLCFTVRSKSFFANLWHSFLYTLELEYFAKFRQNRFHIWITRHLNKSGSTGNDVTEKKNLAAFEAKHNTRSQVTSNLMTSSSW